MNGNRVGIRVGMAFGLLVLAGTAPKGIEAAVIVHGPIEIRNLDPEWEGHRGNGREAAMGRSIDLSPS